MQGFAVIAVVIAVGYVVGRTGVLGEAAVEVLSRTAFFVATPALLFVILAGANVRAVFSEGAGRHRRHSTVVCLSYVPSACCAADPRARRRSAAMASGYVNSGNLGLPIAAYALGDATAVVPVMLFQLAVMTPVFTTMMLKMLTRERDDGRRSRIGSTVAASLTNPIALATFAGLVVSLTGIAVPDMILAPIKLIADLTVPAMLLAFGISLRGAACPARARSACCWARCCCSRTSCTPRSRSGWGCCSACAGTRCSPWWSAPRCRRRRTCSATPCGSAGACAGARRGADHDGAERAGAVRRGRAAHVTHQSASTASNALRAAISTGSHTGENGGA